MRYGWTLVWLILLSAVAHAQEATSRKGQTTPEVDSPFVTPPLTARPSLPKPPSPVQPATYHVIPQADKPLILPVTYRAVSPDTSLASSRPTSSRSSFGLIEGANEIPESVVLRSTLKPEDQEVVPSFTKLFQSGAFKDTPDPESTSGKNWISYLAPGKLLHLENLHLFSEDSIQCDPDFTNFISPVSNPFFAEDPRKLTEIRPIFFFQTIPSSNSLYHGGNAEFLGLQARIGITERLSFVLNKFGMTIINPGSNSSQGNATGFDELWFGPKYTFYRDIESGTVAAGGLTFQLPVGTNSVYQNTGNFGLVPYASVAQKFFKTVAGEFTVLDSLGYSVGFGSGRSDFIYNTLHFDFDVMNKGKFFPLMELNWFYYTTNGTARPTLGFEGRDLANIGAAVNGRNYLSLATGGRIRFTPNFDVGLVGEFPLNSNRDLMNFRLMVDFIFRF